MIMMLH